MSSGKAAAMADINNSLELLENIMANYNPPVHKTSKELEQKIIFDYTNNEKIKDICQRHNVSEGTIINILKRNSVEYVKNRSRNPLWNDPNFDQIVINNWKNTRSIKETASILNLGPGTISKVLKKHNIYYKSKVIIPDDIKLLIVSKFEAGNTLKSIKDEIGICTNIIGAYLRSLGYSTKQKSKLAGYDRYVDEVRLATGREYTKFRNIINPENLKKGKTDYHIDHIYSIYDSYKNNIPVEIVSHHTNLRMMDYKDNIVKGKRSDRSLYDLLSEYFSI